MKLSVLAVFDADRLLAFEQNARGMGADFHLQVRALHCRAQESLRGAPAEAFVGGLLKVADAFLRGAVIVGIVWNADLLGGLDEQIRDAPAQAQVRYLQGSSNAVVCIGAALL